MVSWKYYDIIISQVDVAQSKIQSTRFTLVLVYMSVNDSNTKYNYLPVHTEQPCRLSQLYYYLI